MDISFDGQSYNITKSDVMRLAHASYMCIGNTYKGQRIVRFSTILSSLWRDVKYAPRVYISYADAVSRRNGIDYYAINF